jgi:hypothetical protein
VCFIATVAVSAAGSFFGAIYTTEGDGTTVNGNVYQSKNDVYLNGGPQNVNSKGLPDGTYYFQVTNPSGSDLLSTDLAVCRQVVVINGYVAGASPLSAAAGCAHVNGTPNPTTGATGVQLQPFADTTNSGGEYKVWLIRKADTTTPAGDGIHINFVSSNAKTDNFKIQIPPCTENCGGEDGITLSGHKFYDANANAINDSEGPVAGVMVKITITLPGNVEPEAPVYATTDDNGDWSYGPIPAGSAYVVEELLPGTGENGSYWVQTAPVADSQGFQSYSGTANADVTGLDFGNICFGPASGGYTLGYWSNKNGEKTMNNGGITDVYPMFSTGGSLNNGCNNANASGMNCDLAFLRRLNLRNTSFTVQNPNGDNFDPSSYTAFRTWLLNGNAVSMAYMLSVQLSATSLDVRHGSLKDGQLVDARNVCNTNGTCLGIITIGQVRQFANQSLGSYGLTLSGDPARADQELLKNFLDAVNNNRLAFAHDETCGVVYITL